MSLLYVRFRSNDGLSTHPKENSDPQKRFFAQYVDNVEDVREISGTSRFLSGGMGGITSQLSECPLVTMREAFSLTFWDRHLPSRNTENPDDEQYRGAKTDTCFGRKASLGVGGLEGLLSWARGASMVASDSRVAQSS